MEDFIFRFPHIAEKIFEQLDNKSLTNCREVTKSWQNFINEINLIWIRIVNIPTILSDGDTYLHLAAQTGQTEMFGEILADEHDKNPKNNWGWTPFHLACYHDQLLITGLLLRNSSESDMRSIDLNTKDNNGRTGLHIASSCGQLSIVETLMKNSSDLDIDLNAKDSTGMQVRLIKDFAGRLDTIQL